MSTPILPAPWMYGRRKLTRVEIAVYAVVVGTLIVIFSSYMLDYMEMAEKTAMETTVSNVTAALNLNYAARIMAGERVDAASWIASDPFRLAKALPAGYAGDLDGRDKADFGRPAWLYDAEHHQIVYLPRLHSHLQGLESDEIRFGLKRHPSGFGFMLAPVWPYEWRLNAG